MTFDTRPIWKLVMCLERPQHMVVHSGPRPRWAGQGSGDWANKDPGYVYNHYNIIKAHGSSAGIWHKAVHKRPCKSCENIHIYTLCATLNVETENFTYLLMIHCIKHKCSNIHVIEKSAVSIEEQQLVWSSLLMVPWDVHVWWIGTYSYNVVCMQTTSNYMLYCSTTWYNITLSAFSTPSCNDSHYACALMHTHSHISFIKHLVSSPRPILCTL